MRTILISIVLILAGCGSPLINLHDYLPESERVENNKTIDSVLKFYFTEEAYEVLKDIPVLDGPTYGGSYVAGCNFWGDLMSFISFNGTGRKIIMNDKALKSWGVGALIHEYIHHLDSMTRDGEADFINIEEFLKEFHKLPEYHTYLLGTIPVYQYVGHYSLIKKKADRWITNNFGIGKHSELIAYAAQYLLRRNDWPEEYRKVFRKVFK